MKFTCFQQSSADVDYLLSEQYEDEDTEVFEKSRESSLPQRRFLDRMPRAILAWTVMSTCYAILVTVILAVQMVKSKYEGPGIIYSKQLASPISPCQANLGSSCEASYGLPSHRAYSGLSRRI